MEDEKKDILNEDSDLKKDKGTKKDKTKDKIIMLQIEIDSLHDKLLRNAAELENFKKRISQERINDRKYASSALIHDLLIPLDQLERVVSMHTDNEMLKNFLIGFKMISDQIFSILESDGLSEIIALGKEFDPNFHHAVEKVSDPKVEDGIIVEVTQKGYLYKDKLLRPVMVKVNELEESKNGEDK